MREHKNARVEHGPNRIGRASKKVPKKKQGNPRKNKPGNKSKPNKSNPVFIANRKIRKDNVGVRYRDNAGRFVSKRKWESINLPKRKTSKKRKVYYTEKERFFTEGMRYEYREFELTDYAPETFEKLIGDVLSESKPHPSVFHTVVEYTTEDDILGTFSTRFLPFRLQKGDEASNEIFALAGEYQVSTIDKITLYATYALQDGKNVKR